jgi:hypothetical protein
MLKQKIFIKKQAQTRAMTEWRHQKNSPLTPQSKMGVAT